jgi:hypothetical protein
MNVETDIFAVLREPTEFKSATVQTEPVEVTETVQDDSFSETPIIPLTKEDEEAFSPSPDVVEPEVIAPEPEPEPEISKVSPEESAQTFTTVLNSINITVLTPWLVSKLKKKFGIKVNKEAIAEAVAKDLMGSELSDEESALLGKLKTYEQRMGLLSETIPFADAEQERLRSEFKRICEKRGWSAPAELGAISVIVEVMSKRVLTIISA